MNLSIEAYHKAGCLIQCEIEPVDFDDMANKAPAESSASIRERVIKARAIQTAIGYRALDRASYGQIF